MTFRPTARRMIVATAIFLAIALTLFLVGPSWKGVSLAQASAENNPATGAPTISGTVRVGEVLEVDTSGIADANGLANATFSYQWITDDSVIVASAARIYTPTDGDRGKSVKVRVRR